MAEKEVAVRKPEAEEQAGDCCEPECGPMTCGPDTEATEAKVVEAQPVEEPKKASSGCGPSTCS